jgi:soluble lytic murein transglycosylase-like protein
MRKLHGTYVHRGDGARRRARLRRWVYAIGFCAAAVVTWRYKDSAPTAAEAAPAAPSGKAWVRLGDDELRRELATVRGELNLLRAQHERAEAVIRYSSQYRIAADLAGSIFDVALAEGIDPELAFRLVKLESNFNVRARSPVGALGLTQLMLPTARHFQKDVTPERLFEPKTNLRIGFRYLRGLVKDYDGDVNLALLVYNRGPVAVNAALREGRNPTNGYDRIVTRGYNGSGIVD